MTGVHGRLTYHGRAGRETVCPAACRLVRRSRSLPLHVPPNRPVVRSWCLRLPGSAGPAPRARGNRGVDARRTIGVGSGAACANTRAGAGGADDAEGRIDRRGGRVAGGKGSVGGRLGDPDSGCRDGSRNGRRRVAGARRRARVDRRTSPSRPPAPLRSGPSFVAAKAEAVPGSAAIRPPFLAGESRRGPQPERSVRRGRESRGGGGNPGDLAGPRWRVRRPAGDEVRSSMRGPFGSRTR